MAVIELLASNSILSKPKTKSQVELALIGEELAQLSQGLPSKYASGHIKTQEEVATELGISQRLISNARTLKRKGSAERHRDGAQRRGRAEERHNLRHAPAALTEVELA